MRREAKPHRGAASLNFDQQENASNFSSPLKAGNGSIRAVAAMSLLRLVREGLASRHRSGERGAYRYRLSERGRSRLEYLRSRRGPQDKSPQH